ncbi:acetate--CoA ligase family protein [Desulfovibrio sp. UCD-KL4C]|uniref:acetate--CoA ligase family protein n=1 Tax=Desulfovibrio sp. UCD-KL4C TaxID=2578120 RepID=UPI0025C38F9A|nr:acetate--CoA ligase [Desulfovibrio sp. UCD-KL4C]
MLKHLLDPQSVAVIGGSDDIGKPGGRLLSNILERGYKGRVMVVNPKSDTVQGVPASKNIAAMQEIPDLAYLAIPARFVRTTLEELCTKGVKAAVILSAGFGELNEEGKAEERRFKEIADANDMLLLGPNCLGVMSTEVAGKFAGILPLMSLEGIDFLSGSGATIDYLAEQATKRGLPFNSFMTVGNSAQTEVTDLLDLFDKAYDEKSSTVKILYMETINDPKKLIASAKSLAAKGCHVAGIKAGATEAGNRAAASHTGALVSSDTAVQAMFDKAGIIRVQSRIELIDIACIMRLAKDKLDGKRVCIVTDAGGPGVLLADELNRQEIEAPVLKTKTQKRLEEALMPSSSVVNPIDCLPARTAQHFADIFQILSEEEADSIDYIMVVLGDSGLSDISAIYDVIIKAMNTLPMPIFPSFCTAVTSVNALKAFTKAGKSYFEDEVAMGKALGRVVNRPRIADSAANPKDYDLDRLKKIMNGKSNILDADTVAEVLTAAGINLPGQQSITSRETLHDLTEKFPFPWVMKVEGPLHKTDVGGVKLSIGDLTEAQAAYDALMNIPDAVGVLIQQMIQGTEVIIGIKREEPFGSLTAFGLGGIYAEAMKDIQFRLAPLAPEEALDMINSIAAAPIIKGVRGEQGMDLDILSDQIVRVSRLAADFPQIVEMDINPLKGFGANIYAVDARIICE